MEKLKSEIGWACDYGLVPNSGLVLVNVKHDGYNLARDIRVVGIWVYPLDGSNPKKLCLGTDAFPGFITNPLSGLSDKVLHAPAPFDIYTKSKEGVRQTLGVQAKYKTKSNVFGNDQDADDGRLEIEQTFIFTKYGKDPVHEPGGILEAARVFPLIKFKYGGKKIKTIRIDYRFNASLDLFLYGDSLDKSLDEDLLKLLTEEKRKNLIRSLKDERPMLAAIFRDNEDAPLGTGLETVFAAAEKPVLSEVVGYGLKNGIPGDKVTETIEVGDQSTWDNIHLWANIRYAKLYLKRQPSSPGAFHSLHFHWRWGHFTGAPTLRDRAVVLGGGIFKGGVINAGKFLGEEQFKGKTLNGNIGGPLLDPKIPTQTIQFAITKSEDPDFEVATDKTNLQNKWDAAQCPSTQVFEDLFIKASTKTPGPRDISKGEDIITWYSISVENSDTKKQGNGAFEGTVLVHGLYFAHNAELKSSPFFSTIKKGLQKPQYPEPTWRRSPNGK